MVKRSSGFPLAALSLGILLVGCGSGGSSAKKASLNKATAQKFSVATIRVMRAALAMTGLARRVSRAHSGPARLPLILAAVLRTRDTPTTGLDDDTGLYYSLAVQPDDSGQQLLFTDASRTKPAGSFTWTAPQWNGGKIGDYPALFHIAFQITAGDFKGDHGTIDFDANDATGGNGTLHVVLTTGQGEHSTSDFVVRNGTVSSGKDKITLTDGTSCNETDTADSTGLLIFNIIFDDGSNETIDMGADGSGTETLTGPDGTQDASGTYDSAGTDTLTFPDGTTNTVNVDTSTDDTTPPDETKKVRTRSSRYR